MHLLIISNNSKRASFRQRIGIYLDSLRADGINCKVAKLPVNETTRARLFTQSGMEHAHKEFNCTRIAKLLIDLIEKGYYDAAWKVIL